jgi:sulfite exporter TauE/SafE/copper chaperone CopZ/plastocyanin domain-containing protein
METKILCVDGMSCVNCQNKIEKALKNKQGIEDAKVSYTDGTASVTYNDGTVTLREIVSVIEELDYKVFEGEKKQSAVTLSQIGGYVVIIIALWMLLQQFGFSQLSSAFPLAEAGMGYGMLFVIGLITSVHCVAMCGGINLSQCIPISNTNNNRLMLIKPGILYNGGRIISYTIVGGIVGAVGSVITVSGRFQGIIQIIAGVFMVVMGLNMLGIAPALRKLNLRLPKFFAEKIEAEKNAAGNPFIIGLLNGLMPCGPLQAMQLYALSTGSALSGAVAMFLFSAGTVPLMFGLGALSSMLSARFTARVMKVGALLVAVLGLTMFSNGWSLGALPNPADSILASFNKSGTGAADKIFIPVIEDGVQIVNSTLSGGRYPAITVQQGIPVKWIINAPAGSINGCNNRMLIREYRIEHRFTAGENTIEFLPEKTGRFTYSCWMGMIRSSITVVAEGENSGADANTDIFKLTSAGVVIPTEKITVSNFIDEEKYQTVTINLRDDGFDSSVIVVQKNIPAVWIINNDSLEPGNDELIFPAYYTTMPMQDGDNIIQLIPTGDFDFSTSDNVYYGFVKVVDDINNIDIDNIKNEVAGWETQIYPPEYFEQASSGASCCG